MLASNVLTTLLSGSHRITFVNVQVTGADVIFCDGPGILIHNTAKRALQHVNCFVNTRIFAGQTTNVKRVRHSFVCDKGRYSLDITKIHMQT